MSDYIDKISINYLQGLWNRLTRLSKDKGLKKYFVNTGWLMLEQVVRLVNGVIIGILVVRYLGPEKYGEFSFALSFIAIFAGLAKLGLDGIIVRELVRNSMMLPFLELYCFITYRLDQFSQTTALFQSFAVFAICNHNPIIIFWQKCTRPC